MHYGIITHDATLPPLNHPFAIISHYYLRSDQNGYNRNG